MKTLAYLECSTGIAGDMCLGALLHAGVPLDYLTTQLAKLGIDHEFELQAESVLRNQQAATKAHVKLLTGGDDEHSHHGHHHHAHEAHHHHAHEPHHHHAHQGHRHSSRRLPEIAALITQANLPQRASEWSLAVFQQLAEAEAAVHGISPEQVHFHEVGATDAIVDIVGTCLGLDWLEIDAVICSPLPTGGGTVRCEHGLLSVPAPAVLHMLTTAQVPVYSNGIDKELVTPTGCAIATTLAQSFGPPPRFTLQKVGLGAGGRDLPLPNILRLWIGTAETTPAESAQSKPTTTTHSQSTHTHHHPIQSNTTQTLTTHASQAHASQAPVRTTHSSKTMASTTQANITHASPDASWATETIIELQTQVDDCSPQAIGYLYEPLFAAGAVDVFTQAVAMKKNRLGTLITVLCLPSAAAACEMVLFCETTTLGIRRTMQARTTLAREILTVATPYGDVAVKVARDRSHHSVLNVQPEYEDCAKIARSHNIPWQQAHQAALSAALATPALSTDAVHHQSAKRVSQP